MHFMEIRSNAVMLKLFCSIFTTLHVTTDKSQSRADYEKWFRHR